jgi:integrase
MASALVHAGTSREEITSLAVLVEMENLKKGLRYIMDRFEGKPTEAIHGLAMGLKAIARHHVRISEADLDQLRKLCSRLNLEVDGLREKNRRRLEQLEDENNLARLLHLPTQLIREAGSPRVRPHKAALLVQAALAIEILLYAPMRIGNLSGLDLERHLRPVTVKRQRLTQISIPAEEVKNGKPLTYELGSGTSQLLDLYCHSARPVLLHEPSEYLFPAQDGGPKRTSALSALIKKTIWEYTGLDINAHLFRSIAAKIHNRVHPGDFLTHSHVIGDSLRTAMRAYAQFEQKNALRHYQKSVDAARKNLRPD